MQERKSFDFPPNVLYENRYCYQDDFSVLVCGGRDKNYEIVKSIFKFYCLKFECEDFTSMPNPREYCKTVVTNSNLFVFGGYYGNSKNNDTLIRYCNKTKIWSSKASRRQLFCVCFSRKTFM